MNADALHFLSWTWYRTVNAFCGGMADWHIGLVKCRPGYCGAERAWCEEQPAGE